MHSVCIVGERGLLFVTIVFHLKLLVGVVSSELCHFFVISILISSCLLWVSSQNGLHANVS